jgi:hypothetical protein
MIANGYKHSAELEGDPDLDGHPERAEFQLSNDTLRPRQGTGAKKWHSKIRLERILQLVG